MNSKLLILGTRGMAKMAIEAIEGYDKYSEIAVLEFEHNHLFNRPIIGRCDDLEKFKKEYKYAIACITDCKTRMDFLHKLIAAGYEIPNIIHPRAYISNSVRLGIGIFVNALAVIQSDSKLGDGCFINTGAIVSHDNTLGECVHIGPNASTTGYVQIGCNTLIGACSCVINKVCIGKNAIVAAGATVISDVPDNVMVAGCPAKIKKQYIQ